MWKLGTLAKWVWIPSALGVWWYAAMQNPEIQDASLQFAGWVSKIMETWLEGLSKIPIVWDAAAFAAPVIGWGTIWYKLVNTLNIEGKYLKPLSSAVWIGVWASLWFMASKSVLAPYLAAYWIYKTWKSMVDKNLIPRFVKGIGSGMANTWVNIARVPAEFVSSIYDALQENSFQKPNLCRSYKTQKN